ncbi:MAG TPA: hypothetical protein P5291_02520 [Flavobacteriales bacterium]|nr:hypothetical protein [Flavobacteriales bacterium]
MKRNIHLLLALATASSIQATDRVVSPSGTYNTISSAIAASSDGDRVLVEPANYTEDVLLGKSLSILCNQEGGRYKLNGSLTLVAPSGKDILISGIRVMNGVGVSGTTTAPGTFRMVDSYASHCNLEDPYLHVELYRDTVAVSIFFSAGTVAGNIIPGTSGGGGAIVLSGASQLVKESWIIGNAISYQYNGWGVSITTDAVFHVENNFMRKFPGAVGMTISRSQEPAASISTIVNNTFYMPSGAPTTCINNANLSRFNLLVKNNVMVGYNAVISQDNGWTQLVGSHNLFAAPSWIDLTTGQSLAATPLIDAGDPDPRYLDLDLTTNDVGCYGGSNSRANFTTPMGSAVVGFMNAPRVVAQGETVNISATGFDR